jgi:hypothetical protein
MTARPPIELQRLRYWQGQRLRSRDFRDQLAIDAEHRWWHNRALHGAVGIAEGLEVQQSGMQVTVTAGLGYDRYGRELLLPCSVDLELPKIPPAEELTLLIGLMPEHQRLCSSAENIDGACLPVRQCRSNPDIAVRWTPTRCVGPRDGLPLASLDPTRRLTAFTQQIRPIARPRIASGRTVPGHTNWQGGAVVDGLDDGLDYGFYVAVDTSAGGFTDTPHYFAWLQGPRLEFAGRLRLLVVFDRITKTSPGAFVFRILVIPLGGIFTTSRRGLGVETFRSFARCRSLHVCWLGIECRAPIEPLCCRRCGQSGCCEECIDEHA